MNEGGEDKVASLIEKLENDDWAAEDISVSDVSPLIAAFLSSDVRSANLEKLVHALLVTLGRSDLVSQALEDPRASGLLRKAVSLLYDELSAAEASTASESDTILAEDVVFLLVLLLLDVASNIKCDYYARYEVPDELIALLDHSDERISLAMTSFIVVLCSELTISKLLAEDRWVSVSSSFAVRLIHIINREKELTMSQAGPFLCLVYRFASTADRLLFYDSDHAVLEEVYMRIISASENVELQIAALEVVYAMLYFLKPTQLQHRKRWFSFLQNLHANTQGTIHKDVVCCAEHLLENFSNKLD
eukprot:ANDGO_02612.mRNA.1 hypothetical protein